MENDCVLLSFPFKSDVSSYMVLLFKDPSSTQANVVGKVNWLLLHELKCNSANL